MGLIGIYMIYYGIPFLSLQSYGIDGPFINDLPTILLFFFIAMLNHQRVYGIIFGIFGGFFSILGYYL